MSHTSPAPMRSVLTAVRVVAGAGALMIAISTSLASQRVVRSTGADAERPARAEQAPVATGGEAVTTCGGNVAA